MRSEVIEATETQKTHFAADKTADNENGAVHRLIPNQWLLHYIELAEKWPLGFTPDVGRTVANRYSRPVRSGAGYGFRVFQGVVHLRLYDTF